jgi:hypothetical protein
MKELKYCSNVWHWKIVTRDRWPQLNFVVGHWSLTKDKIRILIDQSITVYTGWMNCLFVSLINFSIRYADSQNTGKPNSLKLIIHQPYLKKISENIFVIFSCKLWYLFSNAYLIYCRKKIGYFGEHVCYTANEFFKVKEKVSYDNRLNFVSFHSQFPTIWKTPAGFNTPDIQ